MNNLTIKDIVHFKYKVFPKATVDTEILIVKNTEPSHNIVSVAIIDNITQMFKSDFGIIQHLQKDWQVLDGEPINIFLNSQDKALVSKCKVNTIPLADIARINVGIKPYQTGKGKPQQTAAIVKSRPFDSKYPIDDTYRPYLRGCDITRYSIKPLEARYIKYGVWLAEPRPAANFDAVEKIVIRQTGDSLIAALDTSQYICMNNMHVIVPNDNYNSKYILGLINSKLLNWYYHTLNPEVGEALAEVKKTNVGKLPIHIIDELSIHDKEIENRIIAFVDQMLTLIKHCDSAKIDQEKSVINRQIEATDRQIDALVYELYGLTKEEIEIVETATKSI
jgi:hypothetical protein